MAYRDETKTVQIGKKVIGGGNPILLQSMCNTKTEDVKATIGQILELQNAGCDIIRVAVPTMEAAMALTEIKKAIRIPLVADIHFDYRLAIAALIKSGSILAISVQKNAFRPLWIKPGNTASLFVWASTAVPWKSICSKSTAA